MQPIAVESHPPPGPQKPTTTPTPTLPHPKSARGQNMKATAEPRQILPCAVYEEQGHATQKFPEIPIICMHLDAMDTIENLPMVELPSGPIVRNKSLRTTHDCTLCRLYGHYYHHCQDLSAFQIFLANLRQHALETKITLIEEIHPLLLLQIPCPVPLTHLSLQSLTGPPTYPIISSTMTRRYWRP